MPEQKVKNVARVIGCFFSAVRDLRQAEWNDPNAAKVILTNNGYAVFFLLFSDIVKHFNHIDQKAIRDPQGHSREDTKQELIVAVCELRWFSQVLGDNSLNPYAT